MRVGILGPGRGDWAGPGELGCGWSRWPLRRKDVGKSWILWKVHLAGFNASHEGVLSGWVELLSGEMGDMEEQVWGPSLAQSGPVSSVRRDADRQLGP